MGVAACGDSSATGKQATPTVTPPNTGITQVVGQNSATPTTFVVGGGAGTVGANEICAAAKNVQTSVPASVPAYPGAELRQSYTLDNNGTYGYCVTAAPATKASAAISTRSNHVVSRKFRRIGPGTFGSSQGDPPLPVTRPRPSLRGIFYTSFRSRRGKDHYDQSSDQRAPAVGPSPLHLQSAPRPRQALLQAGPRPV